MRPFYAEYAWGYALPIERSVARHPEAVLVFDVREWDASVRRKAREPVFEKTVATHAVGLPFAA